MFNIFSWIISAFVILLASTLQSVTGFGFSLVAIPMLLLIYDAKTAVGINLIITFVSVTVLTLRVRKSIIRPVVKNLFLGALIGLPFGLYIFFHFNVDTLKLLISSVTLTLSLFLILGIKVKGGNSPLIEKIVGGISGLLTGSIGMPGPPIVLFLNNSGLSKEKFRATTANYFALIYPSSLVLLAILGALNSALVLTAVSLIPVAILGGYLGNFIFPYVPQGHFQKAVPILVLSSALYSLLTLI